MKKHLAYLSLAFAAIQVATYFLTFFAVIWLRSDCTVANDYYCSGSSRSELIIPVITFLALPLLIMKLVLSRLGYKISNRRLLAVHLVTAIIVTLVAFIITSVRSGCGCGSA